MENWVPIYGYEDYHISDQGRVRNVKTGRYLKPSPVVGRGFLKVRLYNDRGSRSMYVHRLVAAAYLWDYRRNQEVYHMDQDVTNNAVDNLQVSTRRCRASEKWL